MEEYQENIENAIRHIGKGGRVFINLGRQQGKSFFDEVFAQKLNEAHKQQEKENVAIYIDGIKQQ